MAYKKEYIEQIFSNIYLGGQLEQAVLSPTSPEPMPFSQLFIIYFYIILGSCPYVNENKTMPGLGLFFSIFRTRI